MNRLISALLVAFLLAGCSDAPDQTRSEATQEPGETVVDQGPDAVELTIDPVPQEINGLIWNVSGTVAEPATLSFGVSDYTALEVDVPAGPWEATVQLDLYGERPVEVVAIPGGDTKRSSGAAFTINALAPVTFQVDYGTANQDPVDDSFFVDIAHQAARPMYEERGGRHPDYVNVHDIMVQWEERFGHDVEYSYSESFDSFGVERIDGEGNSLDAGEPPWWCYQVNDEGYVDEGISIRKFAPGDVIAWDLGTCGGVMGGT